MGFGAPLALLALAGIAIPIAAHLMRQKDLPVRNFPTLALLARANAESRRRFRIRDRTLLALRVCAVVALALAAAAPFVWRASAFADGKLVSLVLIVDDSMSMARRSGSGTAMDDALARAEEALEGLGSESEVCLIFAGSPSRTAVARTTEVDRARRALQTATPGARGTDLDGAAALARRALSGARHHGRVLVLSDFASPSGADAVDWPDAELSFEVHGEPAPNVAIMGAVAAPNPATQRVSLRVDVRADDPLQVRVETDAGERLADSFAQPLDGHASLTLEVDPGDHEVVWVRAVADDVLPADDVRPVLLEAPTAASVLLVDGDAAGAVGRGEVAYLSRALEVEPARGGRIRVRTVDADALDAGALEDVDVVFLANVAAPSALAARALKDHHEAGGGLVIGAGDRIDPRGWRARLGSLLPGGLGGELAGPRQLAEDRSGPADVAGLAGVRATRILASDVSAGAEVAARWSDGSPALVLGDRVASWTSTFDDAWTDLPLHPGFVALVHRLARELSDRTRGPVAVAAGDSLSFPEGTRVEDPAGELWSSEAFERTTEPGLYRVRADDGAVLARFVVAAPAEESDLSRGDVPSSDGEASERSASQRAPFGSWLYLLFGFFVLGEGALRARRGSRSS